MLYFKTKQGQFQTSEKRQNGAKKNPAKRLDRDKTKNKHYEQTLFFSQIEGKEKSPPFLSGGYIKNKNYEQTLTLYF